LLRQWTSVRPRKLESTSGKEIKNLRALLRKANEKKTLARRDCKRLQELAAITTAQAWFCVKSERLKDILSLQVADLKHMQDLDAAEQEHLRICLRQFEVRSEDDRIIGKLQREIIMMRTTYRLFARAKLLNIISFSILLQASMKQLVKNSHTEIE